MQAEDCTAATPSALPEGDVGSVAGEVQVAEVSRMLSELREGTSAPSAERPGGSDGGSDGGQAASTAAPPAAPFQLRKPDPAVVNRLRGLHTDKKTDLLLWAASVGAVSRLQTVLAAGADIEARGKGNNRRALHWAANGGHVEAVRFLVERGARVDATSKCKQTPLHLAASRGHTEVVRCLLEAQASVHALDPEKRTPLHDAAQAGHAAVVRLLLEASADPNARDIDGRTPLHEAADSGDADAVAALLEAGADRGAKCSLWGETPLDIAEDRKLWHLTEMLS